MHLAGCFFQSDILNSKNLQLQHVKNLRSESSPYKLWEDAKTSTLHIFLIKVTDWHSDWKLSWTCFFFFCSPLSVVVCWQEAENEPRVGVGIWDDGGLNWEQVNTAVDRRRLSSSSPPSLLPLLMRLRLCVSGSRGDSRGRPGFNGVGSRGGQLHPPGTGSSAEQSIRREEAARGRATQPRAMVPRDHKRSSLPLPVNLHQPKADHVWEQECVCVCVVLLEGPSVPTPLDKTLSAGEWTEKECQRSFSLSSIPFLLWVHIPIDCLNEGLTYNPSYRPSSKPLHQMSWQERTTWTFVFFGRHFFAFSVVD